MRFVLLLTFKIEGFYSVLTSKTVKAELMTEKNKGGRPRKTLTKEQIAQVEKLAALLTTDQLADFFGMGRTTFYDLMLVDTKLAKMYAKGRAKAISEVSKNLVQKAMEGNSAAIMFYLRTQAGWKETTVVQQENKEVKTFSDMYE